MIFNSNEYTSKSVYIGVTIGKTKLNTIPPKYIESFSVDKYTSDSEGAATFRLNLVAPVSSFDTTSADSFTFLLTNLISKSVLSSVVSDSGAVRSVSSSMSVTYGWLGGNAYTLPDATITGCTLDMGDDTNSVKYTVTGVASKILFNGTLKNFRAIDTKMSDEMFDNLLKFPDGKDKKLSYIIEEVAKFLYGDSYNIVVDHNDRVYDESERSKLIASFSSTTLDKSSMTLFKYLDKLIESCSVASPYIVEGATDLSGNSLNKDLNLPTICVNGVWYKLDQHGGRRGYSYSSYVYDPNGSPETNYPFDDINLSEAVSDIDNGVISVQGDDNKLYVFEQMSIDEQRQIKNNTITGGVSKHFNKYLSRYATGGKYTLKITAEAPEDVKVVFVISNNNRNSNIVNFSISTDTLAAISAMSAIKDGKNSTSTVDSQSGLSIVSTTDLGGLSASSVEGTSILQKEFLLALVKNVSNMVSEAQLTVFATPTTCSIESTDIVRVVPTINNGNTYFVGDYLITKITDTIDSGGFKTQFTLKFKESELYDSLQTEIEKQKTSAGVDLSGQATTTESEDTTEKDAVAGANASEYTDNTSDTTA